MADALLVENVSKRFAGHLAVDDLSLRIPRATIWGILGPNGAGKSTTLRMVMNIIARDSGRVLLGGSDPERDRRVLHRVGYLPEERGLYRRMKVLEVIEFFATLKGMTRADARRRAETWLERMGLADWRQARIEMLSKGMQQKVQFITTVLHEPEILILDEPFSGLDPVNQEVLRETVLEARAAGRSVILSTHNMDQAQNLCEGICIISQGRKVLEGNIRAVRRAHRGNQFRVEFDEPVDGTAAAPAGETGDGPGGAVERFIRSHPLFAEAVAAGNGWNVELGEGATGGDLLSALGASGLAVRSVEHVEPTLHEIFVQHVGGTARTPSRRPEVTHA